jgi:hypothetical protein
MRLNQRLLVRNPSNRPRQGHITLGWLPIQEATKTSPERIVLTDEHGRELMAQVDPIDPADPNRASLAFVLRESARPGKEDYTGEPSSFVVLEDGVRTEFPAGACVETVGTGVRLTNARLDAWISLGPHEGKPWFAGAATSVVVNVQDRPHIFRDRLELLDAHRGWIGGALGHNPEKRCMQVDRIRLSLPSAQELPLFNRPYKIVSSSAGPVRATITLATESFEFGYIDPLTRKAVDLQCRPYRVISLYRDADYLIENLYVTGITADGRKTAPLHFAARYFAEIDMGLYPQITHFAHIPDWLAIGCSLSPYQGYGFATDVHAARVLNPAPWFAGPEDELHKSFSWELGVSDAATCLHLFSFCPPEDLAATIGRAWHDHIFKPLKATLA